MPDLRRRTLIRGCRLLLQLLVVALALLAISGCKESDEQLVEEIGVTRLLLIDTGLRQQSISGSLLRLQAIEWVVSQARLDIDGALVDLLAGDGLCRTVDTVQVDPFSSNLCAQGVVIESSVGQDPFNLKLYLTFDRIEARRAIPPNYLDVNDPTYRDDGDLVPTAGFPGSIFENVCVELNGTHCRDNCPEIPNDQTLPANGVGFTFGAACATAGFRDTDADGIIDGFDNCVYVANTGQEDTMGFGAEGIPDGIGDACESVAGGLGEQAISIALTGGPQLSFENFSLNQSRVVPSFIVVDFNSQATLAGCDLASGTCQMNTAEIRVCTTSDPFAALAGCPG